MIKFYMAILLEIMILDYYNDLKKLIGARGI
jgi:hypothetical protein